MSHESVGKHLVPANDEQIFIRRVRNHAEFRSTLVELSLSNDLQSFDKKVDDVTRCWFDLAREHLDDARSANRARRIRAVYSRAYYAVYNASKAIRYRVNGFVSLKGDDHQKAGDLPDDFPNVASWSTRIPEMYEHRLRADYDNWANTLSEHTLKPSECVRYAIDFLRECEQYIQTKFGVIL